MKRLVLGLAGLFVLIGALHAQDSASLTRKGYNRFFLFGAGMVHHSLYDEAMSTIRYRGTLVAPLLGHEKSNERKHSQWDVTGSFMKYNTSLSNDLLPMQMTAVRFATDYQRLQRVSRQGKKLDIRLGGSASLLFNFRQAPQLDNSQLVYEYAMSAGVGGMATKEIHLLNRSWILRYNMQLPLIAWMYRPPYMNRVEFFNPENELVGYTFRNSRIGTVDKYLRIHSITSLARTLRNGNAVRVGYGWDFYRMKTVNRVFHTEHLLSFTFMFNY